MIERRRAPECVMRDLCDAVAADSRERGAYESHCAGDPTFNAVVAALRVYQHATAQLRTRAEVDAELAAWVRESVTSKRHINPTWERVLRLCSEPTTDAPEADSGWRKFVANAGAHYEAAQQYRCGPCASRGISNPADHDGPCQSVTVERALESDAPEPCGCEETEALKLEVGRLLTLTESSTAPNTLEWRQMVDDLRGRLARIRSMTGTYRSGEPYSALKAIRKECEGA